MRTVLPALLGAALWAASAGADEIAWKKTVIEKKFRSEGVTVADVNHDGKLDIIVGDVWYEAPDWKVHEIRKPGDYGDGSKGYSQSFACWAEDINGDGWADVIVIGFPGAPCYWYENPKNQPGHWKQHQIWHSACNETPQYVDLFGDGKRVLLMGWQPPGKENEGRMAWFAPGSDPTQLWEMHPISEASDPTTFELTPAAMEKVTKDGVPEAVVAKLGDLKGKNYSSSKDFQAAVAKALTPEEAKAHGNKLQQRAQISGKVIPGTHRFAHGLGVGDVNGDGRLDVITPDGWWEQPAEGRKAAGPWKFHKARIGSACADMYAFDADGDGKADVFSSSAHGLGIWWHKQVEGKDGPDFKSTLLFNDENKVKFTQTHAMHFVPLAPGGKKVLITGKRFWAHGPKGDQDPDGPRVLYWIDIKPGATPEFTFHKIDDDSGIGTQFWVGDFNGDGLTDIVIANKNGVFLIEQVNAKK